MVDKKKYKDVMTGAVHELTEKEYYLFPKNVNLVEVVDEVKKTNKVKE
jgi:hypothetical protein